MLKRKFKFVFSLRSLLIVTAVVAVVGGRWVMRFSARRQAYQKLVELCELEELTWSITKRPSLPLVEKFVSDEDEEISHAFETIESIEITRDGGRAFSDEMAECLLHFGGLESVSLDNVAITRRGLQSLQRTKIDTLSLWEVSLESPWHETGSIELPATLRSLRIRGWEGDLSIYSSLDQLSELEELVVSDDMLNDDQMAQICTLTKLKTLRLERYLAFSPNSLVNLANLRELAILELDCAEIRIDDSVIDAIAQLPKLWSLKIVARNVHADSWSKLSNCQSLERLHLIGCPNDETELAGIAQIKNLERIGFEEWGRPVSEKVLSYLLSMDKLEFVNEWNFRVSFRGAKRLVQLPSFTKFCETNTSDYFNREFLETATGDPNVSFDHSNVSLSECQDVSGELGFLQNAPNVSYVELTKTDVNDDDMINVSKAPKLSTLFLDDTRVTDDGIAEIGNAKQLKFLYANGLALDCENFPLFSELEELELSGDDITLAGWTAIAKLPSLEKLEISGGVIDQDVCNQLSKLPSLKQLALYGGCQFKSDAFAPLAQCTTLEKLWLAGTFQNTSATGLGALDQLYSLDLQPTNADDASVKDISGLNNLERLYLSRIGDASLQTLMTLPSLNFLDIDEAQCSKESVAKLCDAMAVSFSCSNFPAIETTNKSLRKHLDTHYGWIQLPHARIDDDAMPIIAHHKDVYSVQIADTVVTDAGIGKLAESSSIAGLDLSGTAVTKVGIESLRPFADQIRRLSLNRTKLDAGVLDELKDWQSLQYLELKETPIDFQAVRERFPIQQLDNLVVADGRFDETSLAVAFGTDGFARGYVILDGPWWTWERAQSIVGNRFVQYVTVSGTRLGDRSVDLLCSLPFLSSINWRQELPSADAIRQLSNCQFLHSIEVRNTRITAEQIAAIASLPQVRAIELAHVENIESLDLSPLATSESLDEVTITSDRESLSYSSFMKATKKIFNGRVAVSSSFEPRL